MKVFRALVVGLAVIAGLLLGGAALGRRLLLEAPAPPDGGVAEIVKVHVARGESFAAVARRLEHEGLIVSARRLRILARIQGADRAVRVGTYAFARGTGPQSILRDFVEGRIVTLKFTIPEGWRLEEIAGEAERALAIPRAEFLAEAADSARIRESGTHAATLEGYLFPETYLFPEGTGAAEVVDAMRARFEANWSKSTADVDSFPLALDRASIVTLASIVEAETGVSGERSRIAAVYLNRLANGWKLQADPTVRYALGKYDGDVLYKDLEIDSPYNSYRSAGLPPGPIGAPGLASIEATLHPLSPCDEFYFVASGEGGHVFTKTLVEHERAKRAAKRARGNG